jgi:hypothetical protein
MDTASHDQDDDMETTENNQDKTKRNKKTKKQVQVVTGSVTNEENDDEEETDTAETEETNPDAPIPINIKKECRFSVTIVVPPSKEPWKALAELLRNFLKLIHEQASNKIYITTWDEELAETEKVKKSDG